jgi:hypothetical protein
MGVFPEELTCLTFGGFLTVEPGSEAIVEGMIGLEKIRRGEGLDGGGIGLLLRGHFNPFL